MKLDLVLAMLAHHQHRVAHQGRTRERARHSGHHVRDWTIKLLRITQHKTPQIAVGKNAGERAVAGADDQHGAGTPSVLRGLFEGASNAQVLAHGRQVLAHDESQDKTLYILADQLAIAIQNANLFSEAEKALESTRATYGQLSREAWNRILRSQARVGFLATPPSTVQIQSEALEPNIAKAIETGDLIHDADGLTISVPVKIRGQIIGAIRLKKSDIAEAWTQDETNLAIALSDQLSGALESARLYRESQQRAYRESLVSDISARINASATRDLIIRETVQELGQSLLNTSVTFQLLDQSSGESQSTGTGRTAKVTRNE